MLFPGSLSLLTYLHHPARTFILGLLYGFGYNSVINRDKERKTHLPRGLCWLWRVPGVSGMMRNLQGWEQSRNVHPAPQQGVGRKGISSLPHFFQHWVKHLCHFLLGVNPCLLQAQVRSHNSSLKTPTRDRTWFGNGLWIVHVVLGTELSPGLRHKIPTWLWIHSAMQ